MRTKAEMSDDATSQGTTSSWKRQGKLLLHRFQRAWPWSSPSGLQNCEKTDVLFPASPVPQSLCHLLHSPKHSWQSETKQALLHLVRPRCLLLCASQARLGCGRKVVALGPALQSQAKRAGAWPWEHAL